MPAFTRADDDTERLMKSTLEKYHQELKKADVDVSVIMTSGLMVHGWPAFARVRIVSQRDRVQGMADAEIAIDEDRWTLLSHDQRVGILDHELEHLQVVTEDDGKVKVDDCSRPRLRIRPHDHQFGWFNSIAERHGANSQEVQQASQFANAHGQLYLPGIAPLEEPADVLTKLTSPETLAKVEKTMRRKGHNVQISLVADPKPAHNPQEDR